MYFSNYSEKNATSHDYINGTYSIEGNIIKTNCQLGWSNLYQTYNAELHVKKVDEFTLDADIVVGGKIVETNTYIKVIEKIELDRGDILPDYAKLLDGKTILKYKSHNNYIATVDEKTGRINSEWSGSTYIDIETDKGTAALQVTVNSILYFDYEDYVGATMKDIAGVFDRQNATDANILIYKYNENYYPSLQRKSGNWKSMSIRLNSISGFVDNISLVAKDDVWFTDYQISDYLSERYTMYQRKIEYDGRMGIPVSEFDKTKDFYIGNSLEEAKVGITWNTDSKTLSFVDLKDEHRNTVDYGHFMLMTAEDIKTIMGEPPFANKDEWIAYRINGRYANTIKFSFKNRYSNKIKKTIQEIDVFLYSDININEAVSVLDKKYEFSDEIADTRIYNSSSPKMMIDIWLGNNTTTKLIQYLYRGIDLDTDEGYLWPEYAPIALKGFDEVKEAMGEPDESVIGQSALKESWYRGAIFFYDIDNNDYVERIALTRCPGKLTANIAVLLKDNIESENIIKYLQRLYIYREKRSDPDNGVFVYSIELNYSEVWIEYDSINGVIYYFTQ